MPYVRRWWPAIASRSSRIPAAGVYPRGSPELSSRIASALTGSGAPVLGCPASRLTRSPWVRCRSADAASRSITWNGGTLARLATSKRFTSPTL